jgi:serine/threonine protein kinase
MVDEESLVGSLFAGRFTIEALLGTGGMGTVYLARHEVLNRAFAIKVIKRNLIRDPDIASRFRREARAASRIEHPAITSVFDFGHTEDGCPYLVMEYVSGPSLDDVLRSEGALPLPRALDILHQIAVGLAAAHAGQVIHRDLKPQNIVLASNVARPDAVKILDFGLAKIIDVDASETTHRGLTFGTIEYMAPEQCTGEGLDHRADIYSLGIIAFEMLAGRPPFAGTLFQMVNQHLTAPPPTLSAFAGRPELAPLVDAIVLRCLAKRPEERFPDASSLARELERARVGPERPRGATRAARTRTESFLPQIPSATPEIATLPTLLPTPSAHLGLPSWPPPAPSPEDETNVDATPGGGLFFRDSQRFLDVDEVACVVRDRGLGSSEISEVLALRLQSEDRAFEIEANLAALRRSIEETERAARLREARLRQALIQIEHEREGIASSSAVGAGPTGAPVKLDENAREIMATLRRIAENLEAQLPSLQRALAEAEKQLEEENDHLALHEERLLSLLLAVHADHRHDLDPELSALFDQAGISSD